MTSSQSLRFLLINLFVFSVVSARILPCLDDCICEENEQSPLIRCENGDRKRIEIPSRELNGYQYIAFTCNDLRELPPIGLLKAAFPSLQGIDIQGNPLFNCSSLGNIREEIAILTDCDPDTKPIKCDVIDKECDWKCKTLNKLRELWRKVKSTFMSKVKEWGAEQTMNEISDWFTSTYRKIADTLTH
ncbi:unnamed protein product [Cylicocyclus nassatus]|uniref:Uncharacterized protein n=1 Tax=Cylicocyclus nassatus TaxID=53992 RepID=A0AA36GWM3_CYLNA|nr:unnamed protein product [Cylicocyclus nassatus]